MIDIICPVCNEEDVYDFKESEGVVECTCCSSELTITIKKPENKTPSQNERILEALRTAPIDPMTAWDTYGVYRLAARISELRKMGHDIGKNTKQVKNRYGESCQVAEYYLIEG